MRIVICGGGIVGSSTAYYLALKGFKSIVVERCQPACAASGKAGGFLARDWCNSYELGPLANTSFDMHMAFAADPKFQDCEYRRLDTLGVTLKEDGDIGGAPDTLPEWMDGPITKSSVMGSRSTTAQVLPLKLTYTMLNMAKTLVGTEVRTGVVSGVQKDESQTVTGVCIGADTIPADVVVMALGPWSNQVTEWFQLATVKGQRAHSVVLSPTKPVSAHACFLEYETVTRGHRSPEIYPRPDGTVYVCGMSDEEKLPVDPADVQPNGMSCAALRDMAAVTATALKDAPVLVEQACYLPMSPDGLPMIGAIPGSSGAYIATGHSCWGILNAPATGEAIAQLIVDGHCSLLDLTPFDPKRFL